MMTPSRQRPANRIRHPLATLAIAVSVVAGSAALAWVAISAPRGVPGASHYTLEAQFRDLANLSALNEVRLAGRRVGQVLNPRLEDGTPTVDLQLDNDVAPLRSDTRVVVRSKGLLGARFAELQPGAGGRELRQGETIPASRTSATVELPKVLATFDAPRRVRLRSLLRGLGEGMLGRGQELNAALAQGPGLARDLRAASAEVLAREGAARRLFPSLESAAAAADPVREEIARGFRPAARALRPFGERREALRGALKRAPSSLDALREGLRRTDPLLSATGELATATTETLAPAPAGFEELGQLLDEAPVPLRLTRELLDELPATSPPTIDAARRLTPVVPRLERALEHSVPPMRVLGPRGCDLLTWARRWRSMLGNGVPGGGEVGPLNVFRFEVTASPETIGGLERPIDDGRFGRSPYPDPCEAATEGRR